MPLLVLRYGCEHCEAKHYKNKSSCVRHEKKCFANPKAKACRTCKNFERYTETVYNRHHGGNPGSTDYEEGHTCCNAYGKEFDGDFEMKRDCSRYVKYKDNFKEE